MNDPTPDPELDELVAAYLDGEATPDERHRVQTDRVLLARAEQLRAVSRMVAEPVPFPDAAQRDAHIAAALEASSTSPVVTSLPTSRNRPDLVRFASIAAVVLAALVAVPLLLANTGDDDVATDATSADDGLAALDSVAAEGADGAAEMDAGEEPTERSSAEFGDEGAAGDGAATDSETTDSETTDSAAAAPSGGDDAEEGFADEESAREEAMLGGDLGAAEIDAALAGVARIDIGRAAGPRALRRQIEGQLGNEAEAGDDSGTAAPTGLTCGPAIAEEITAQGPADAVGSAIVSGVVSEYVFISDPFSMLVVFDATTCAVRFAG